MRRNNSFPTSELFNFEISYEKKKKTTKRKKLDHLHLAKVITHCHSMNIALSGGMQSLKTTPTTFYSLQKFEETLVHNLTFR